jgi:DNA-binding transcriptional regulator YhcF (GntR family)
MPTTSNLPIRVNRESTIPLYNQIKEQIRGQVHAGQLISGDKLPTIKELAHSLSVNFNTVALAYRDLTAQGILVSKRGKGTFVAATPHERNQQNLRQEKLQALVNALLKEAARLDYTPEEVWQTIQAHFMR